MLSLGTDERQSLINARSLSELFQLHRLKQIPRRCWGVTSSSGDFMNCKLFLLLSQIVHFITLENHTFPFLVSLKLIEYFMPSNTMTPFVWVSLLASSFRLILALFSVGDYINTGVSLGPCFVTVIGYSIFLLSLLMCVDRYFCICHYCCKITHAIHYDKGFNYWKSVLNTGSRSGSFFFLFVFH